MNATAQQQELITTEEPARAVATSETVAIVQMIERAASNPNVDIDKMERLLEMQERVIARNARSAYAAAFADMQQDLPTIAERGVGDKKMKYALWEDINDAIKPVLAKYGFGISFKTGRTTERVTVTAILMHRAGHSEETTLELPVDTSGSKNAVQAVGSSTSYGKRYTAQALLNLTSRDGIEHDDDGKGSGAPIAITEAQANEIYDLIGAVGADRKRFLAHIKAESVEAIPAKQFENVVEALEAKRRAAK
jgi:hypothetical protein